MESRELTDVTIVINAGYFLKRRMANAEQGK